MSFAFPMGFLLGLLALPLVALYFLKLRRRAITVSSVLPWRRVIEDRRANAPWERLRRHLLLLLQLLALALLVLAFAGPFHRSRSVLAHDTAIVLDVSASMAAREDEGATRLDLARREIVSLLQAVDGSRRVALVLAGPVPTVACSLTGERTALRRGLEDATQADAPADMAAALELAATLVRPSSGGEVVLVTDGAFDPSARVEAALEGVRVMRVGTDRGNVGVTALALRPAPAAAGEHELFVEVLRRGADVTEATLVLEAESTTPEAGQPSKWAEIARTRLVLAGGESRSHLFRAAAPAGRVLRVTVSSNDDALATDDSALLVVPPRDEVRVLLVSSHPYLLGRALSSVDGVTVDVTPRAPTSDTAHDLLVVEGSVDGVLPALPILAFGASAPRPEGVPLLAATERLKAPRVLRWDRRHPVLRHADLEGLAVGSAWKASPPVPASVLVESDAGPIAFTWAGAGGPVVAFAFDLLETDLPLRVAFPVLVHDALDWLTDRSARLAVRPTGRPDEVRVAPGAQVELVGADGTRSSLEVAGPAARIPAVERVGLYRLESRGDGGRGELLSPASLAFALLSPEETDLSARIDASVEARATPGGGGPQRAPGRRFLWPWAVAACLCMLLLEWAVYHRRLA